jgi:hypothetical protein
MSRWIVCGQMEGKTAVTKNLSRYTYSDVKPTGKKVLGYRD